MYINEESIFFARFSQSRYILIDMCASKELIQLFLNKQISRWSSIVDFKIKIIKECSSIDTTKYPRKNYENNNFREWFEKQNKLSLKMITNFCITHRNLLFEASEWCLVLKNSNSKIIRQFACIWCSKMLWQRRKRCAL